MKIALIENTTVHQVWSTNGDELAIRYDLPDGSQLSPVYLGWKNERYSIVAVTEFVIPDGKQIAGPAEYVVDGNSVTETYPVEDIPVYVPDRVTARQFKLQLLAMGLYDTVTGWVGTQSQAVQIAYEYSGTFLRSEPMMLTGFAAMGFTDEQIDAFYQAASEI